MNVTVHDMWGAKTVVKTFYIYPVNIRRRLNAGLLLGQRRRRWTNSKPTLGRRLMFSGYSLQLYIQWLHCNHPFLYVCVCFFSD